MLEAREPSVLRYAWVGDTDNERTEVTFTLEPTPQGTRLTFVHDGFEGAESIAVATHVMKPGWEKTFDVETAGSRRQRRRRKTSRGSSLTPKFPLAPTSE